MISIQQSVNDLFFDPSSFFELRRGWLRIYRIYRIYILLRITDYRLPELPILLILSETKHI